MFGNVKITRLDGISFDKEWSDFRLFAIRCHDSQKYGDWPYAYHLAMVEHILIEHGFNEYHYQAAGWLHDVLEDTDAVVDKLNQNFGAKVAGIVFACTGEGCNRKARTSSIYSKLEKHPIAAPVKVADRLANTMFSFTNAQHTYNTDKLEMYVNEWDVFKERIMPLMIDSVRGRLLWSELETITEKAKEAIPTLKAAARAATEKEPPEPEVVEK